MTAKTVLSHTLGFPRMGAQRELKFALEQHWKGQLDAAGLQAVGAALREKHWAVQRAAGLDFVTVGDFAYYDHVANHIQMLGCEPTRFGFAADVDAPDELSRYFAMARGVAPAAHADTACAHAHSSIHLSAGQPALDMTKWFDTNYHYLVPEFSAATRFSLASTRLLDEVRQAQALGHPVKAVLLGPLSFLWLGKENPADQAAGFNRFSLLDVLLPVYDELLARLKALGVAWVQVDEPILGLDLPDAWRHAFEKTYWQLARSAPPILLATYFSPLQDNLRLACQLPVAGLHVDAVRAAEDLSGVADWLPSHKVLSVGVVDGRNVWRCDMDKALALLRPLADKHGGALWLAPSCSLLHVPYSLALETVMDPDVRAWLAFAVEKLDELHTLKAVLNGQVVLVQAALNAARHACATRRASPRVHRADVALRLARRTAGDDQRSTPFSQRQALQRARLALPLLPTTTIGSFPQTPAIRAARAAFKRGDLSEQAYRDQMAIEITHAVRQQEALGLDVLVHGEAERNDMVEYFGEQLAGFAFSSHGWVQSYGSRCVKPPLIYGDVARVQPMTVDWTVFAQSLTPRPLKGMLTGPITILQWSFVRDDQPRSQTAEQIAWAIRDEVQDLEHAGIGIIQIDEPAIREGLPLRRAAWRAYLAWATRAFRLSASGVADTTQIHTHMCYSEFNDILPEIASLDADVITIETSRSGMELLRGFGQFKYPNDIGPGVYDIHSPRVPTVEAMVHLLHKAASVIAPANLWINPDCGLKTRGWPETEAALANMVEAARRVRLALVGQGVEVAEVV